MTREEVYAAVFEFFSGLTQGGAPLFRLATRRAKVWEDVSISDQPALLLQQDAEIVVRVRGLPSRWDLRPNLLVYVHTAAQIDPTQTPAQIINPLLDTIERSLAVDDIANEACTLGGRVSHCCIDGTVETFLGESGDEAVVKIPLSILVPTFYQP